MATKTRNELELEIKCLREQIENQSREEQLDKAAQDVRALYDSFIKAGFTEEQSWEMIKIQLINK